MGTNTPKLFCYCPKHRNKDAAGESSWGAEGRARGLTWEGRQNICPAPPKISLSCYWILHWVSQGWKGRKELSTGRDEEFPIRLQLFHILSFLVTRLQNICWIIFPFTVPSTPQPPSMDFTARGEQRCQETRLKQKVTASWSLQTWGFGEGVFFFFCLLIVVI